MASSGGAVRTLRAEFEARFDGMTAALRAIREQAQLTAQQSGDAMANMGRRISTVGRGMTGAGKTMSLAITAPLVGIATVSAKTAIDFEAQMSRVGAIAGASSGELQALKESALELGAATSKSASEVAIAQEGLAAMGFTANEIIGAMPGVISAAESSGADMAQTADTMAAALNIFGLEATDATKVADIFAQTANVSAADMTDLQYALKYAGPPAAALGVSLEELSGSIGIMADSGIAGESAGTSLRAAMLALLNPSEKNTKAMKEMGFSVTDAAGNFVGISEMIRRMQTATEGQTETQKAATIAQLVGTEATSGMLALMSAGPEKIDEMTLSLENSGGQSEKTAKLMKDNLKGAIDEMGGAMETAAITIGTILTPYIQKATVFIQGLVQKFQDASPAVQKAVVVAGAFAAALGPLTMAAGFVVTSIGGIMTTVGTLTPMIAAAGGLVPALTTFGGTLLGLATGPIGIAVAAIAGIVVGGGLLVNHLRKDAIPEVDRFGKGVSEKTKQALGAFFDLSDGAQKKLTEMRINGTEVTASGAKEIVANFEAMNKQVLTAMQDRHGKQIADMENFFMNSSALSEEKESEIIRQQKLRNDMKEVEQQHFEDRIQQILETAAKENRALTDSEAKQINEIQKQMQENAVEYLSASEMEQKIIMERLASSNEALSARQAAAVVKNSADARDKVIKDADKKYNDVVAFAIRERDETGSITAKQAEDIIREAKKTRDTTVGHAEDQHEKIVTEAKEQAGEHVNQVDWETGQILTKWGAYKQGVLTKFRETNKESLEDFKRWGTDFNTNWNSFNTAAQKVADKYKADVKKKFTDLNRETKEDFTRWASEFNTAWNNFNDKAKATVDDYKKNVKKKFTDFNSETKADFSRWASDFNTGWNNFNSNAKRIVEDWKTNVKQKFFSFFSDTKRDFSTWGSNIRTYTSETFNNIRQKISDTWGNVKQNVSTSVSSIYSNVKTTWSNLLSNTKTQMSNVYTAARDNFNKIVDGAKALPGRISDGLKSMASKVKSGVNSVANTMSNTLETGVNGVINGINGVLKALGASGNIKTINLPTYAYGTGDKPGQHPGGLAVVGDGKGSNAGPELIETPDGKSQLSPGTPTLVNLPKGTKVYSATVTRQLAEAGHLNLPHYAAGDALRSVGSWIKSKVAKGASALLGLTSNPLKMLEEAMGVSTPKDDGGFIGGMVKGGFMKAKNSGVEYIKKKIADYVAKIAAAAASAGSTKGSNLLSGGGGSWPSAFRFTSGPGPRNTGIPGASTYHMGWDWAAPSGTPIPSQSNGVVSRTGYNPISGNFIEVNDAAAKRIHRYQHNLRNSAVMGQTIKKGQTVGLVGSTGVGGTHVHYEIKKYAEGGVATKKQLAWLADGGWAESIISHDPAKRATQGAIWQKTGQELGFTGDQLTGNQAITILERIAAAVEAGHGHPIVMNEQLVAEILKDPITRLQELDAEVRGAFGR